MYQVTAVCHRVATITYSSFGRTQSGRLITAADGMAVVQARNPHGTHNLVLVDMERGEAIRHGTLATLECVANWMPSRAYRRVRKHLATRGIGRDWVAA